jgi:hypothetical protein
MALVVLCVGPSRPKLLFLRSTATTETNRDIAINMIGSSVLARGFAGHAGSVVPLAER